MIVGVDIGGTKTYVALFAENGKLLKEVRFETNRDYDEFLKDLKLHANNIEASKAKAACVAVPGLLDRKRGMVLSLGNLPWKDKYIRHDAAKALGVQNVSIENDSRLAGLAEARYVSAQFSRVFYITISTGIGGALIVDGTLSKDLLDMEIGKTPLPHEGSIQQWENFASGKAFFETYGKKAVEVEDKKIWKKYSQNLNIGLGMICSGYQPEVIIFGGGLGQRLSRFKPFVEEYFKENLHSIVRTPKSLLSTHFRGQSVVYGCYVYAKDKLA